MANTHSTLASLFTAIADKIRKKTGSTTTITADNFPDVIDSILTPTDGTIATKTSSDLTASGATVTVPAGYYDSQASKSVATTTRADTTISVTADDTNDKLTITASNNQSTGYVTGANKTATTTITLTANGSSVTASDGNKSVSKSVATATQATPSISVSTSGLITASSTQSAGYVSAGTKSETQQLTTKVATTYTPTTSNQTIASGTYLTGTQTIKGDSNLKAENIKSGVSIFGVTGGFSGQIYRITNDNENGTTFNTDYEIPFQPKGILTSSIKTYEDEGTADRGKIQIYSLFYHEDSPIALEVTEDIDSGTMAVSWLSKSNFESYYRISTSYSSSDNLYKITISSSDTDYAFEGDFEVIIFG